MNDFIFNCTPMYSVYGRDGDPWTWGNNSSVIFNISNSTYKYFYKKYKKMSITWQSWKWVSRSVTQYLYIDDVLVQQGTNSYGSHNYMIQEITIPLKHNFTFRINCTAGAGNCESQLFQLIFLK